MENKENIISKIKEELQKIDDKNINIYFFVIDTKGNPSGSLEYIYKLAKFINDDGYHVKMLYQVTKDEEFVGVGEWLGEEYASLEHANVSEEELNVSPSDILLIPEIFANVMIQTKKLPCKKIAILQNYDYMVEQMPFAVQWGDLGVMECITNTETNAKLITDSFPYVKTNIITPYIDECFGTTTEPKQMVVNVICKNQSDINRIVKPFYWKYPQFKWVSFKDLRGLKKSDFAATLRTSEITVWVDEESSFGYSALEAMKSGNIVIAKTTDQTMPWAKENDEYKDCCLWFDDFSEMHKILASVIRGVITNKVPQKIYDEAKVVAEPYTKERSQKETIDYIKSVISKRRTEINNLLNNIDNND